MATKTKPAAAPVEADKADTAYAIDHFEETVRAYAAKPADPDQVRAALVKTVVAVPAVFDAARVAAFLRARAKATRDLLDAYVKAKVGAKFPRLDPKLFDLKRHLVFEYDANGTAATVRLVYDRTTPTTAAAPHTDRYTTSTRTRTHCECKLFCRAEVPVDGVAVKPVSVCAFGWSSRTRYNEVKVTAAVPDVPADLVADGQAARAAYLRAVADLCADPKLAAVAAEIDVAKPVLEVAWIPSVKALKLTVETKTVPQPTKADPALVMTVGAAHYLIACYDVADEDAYENYLREFSAGDVSGVIARKAGKK